jgi:2'-hydroxyisoflavone reductase
MTTRRDCLLAAAGAATTALAAPFAVPLARAAPKPLELLLLGGTGFLGPHQVNDALQRGHRVTMFNRGVSAAGLYGDRVELLRGNRDSRIDAGLTALMGKRRWDVVIDNSGYLPRHVRDSAELLRERCNQYIYVSTVAVYDGAETEEFHEDSALLQMADPTLEVENGQTYGPLKAQCERVLRETLGARCTIVRPGFVFGPGDDTDRFTYWIERVARGGDVLAPPYADRELQWVDARDLCPWIIRLAERRVHGIFNAAGPKVPTNWGEVLESLRIADGPPARLHWSTPELLAELKINLPLVGMRRKARRVVSDAAQRAGLVYRPLADTVQATREWWRGLPEARRATPQDWPSAELEQRAIAALTATKS